MRALSFQLVGNDDRAAASRVGAACGSNPIRESISFAGLPPFDGDCDAVVPGEQLRVAGVKAPRLPSLLLGKRFSLAGPC